MSSARNPPAVVAGLYGHGLDNMSQRAQPESAWNTPSLPSGSNAMIRPPLAYSDKLFGSNRQQGRDAETISFTVVGTETVGDIPCLMKKLPMFYVSRRYRVNEGKYPQMLMMNLLCVNKLLSGESQLRSNGLLHKTDFDTMCRSRNPARVLDAFRFYGYLKTATPSLNTSGSMTAQEATFALRGDEEGFNLWIGCDPEGIGSSAVTTGSHPHVFTALRLQIVDRGEGLATQMPTEATKPEALDPDHPAIIGGRPNYGAEAKEARGEEGEDGKEEKEAKRAADESDEEDELKQDECWAFVPVAAYSLADLTMYDTEERVTIPVGMISEWYSGRQKFPQPFLASVLQLPKWHVEDEADKRVSEQDEYAHTSASGLGQLPRIKISLSPVTQISRFVYRDRNRENKLAEFKLTDAFE